MTVRPINLNNLKRAMNEYLDNLNVQQRAAVEQIGGPALVIAGAGSGKTRVLTYKIVHLLNNGFEPYRVLALTFTNKAAREMKQRIEQLVGTKTASRLWMGTFHSIFLRILRQNSERIGFKRDFTIYDTTDSKSLVKTIIKDLGLDDKVYKASTVLNAISMAKNALLSPDAYAQNRELIEADQRARRGQLVNIYRVYRQRCHIAQAMDFDDILYYTNILLRDNADVRAHYREFFRYILVDEYQDTNFAQHLIVSQLANDQANLCVVGDDAQSIYSFRGANIRNILNLKNNYPNLSIFKLEQNYRSTQNIINAANSLIEKNINQIPKKVFSRNDVGSKVEIMRNYSDIIESANVAARISQLKLHTGDSFEDFAILYRTNAQSRILEESLRKQNIPYRIYGGLSFYQRKEVKDALAYFRLAVNPNDDEALKRIINTPGRGIGETTLNKLVKSAIDKRAPIWDILLTLDDKPVDINASTKRKLETFRDMIARFVVANDDGMTADVLAEKIIRESGLLAAYLHDNTPESISKQENIQELLSGVKEYVESLREDGTAETDPTRITMSAYLGQVSLLTDQDTTDTDMQAEERITLMTVHAAKGLEFNHIIIVGAEEELFPSALASGSVAEIEEERRLMYVAITRAKHNCIISYADNRYRNGQNVVTRPSRFIKELDSKYTTCPVGIGNDRSTGHNSFERYRTSFHSPSSVTTPNPRQTFSQRQSTSIQADVVKMPGEFTLHYPNALTVGMTIAHERFGHGTIIDIDTTQAQARISVKFDNLDTKTLLLKYARFKIISQ